MVGNNGAVMSQPEGDAHAVGKGVQNIDGIGDVSAVPRSEDDISSCITWSPKCNGISLLTQRQCFFIVVNEKDLGTQANSWAKIPRVIFPIGTTNKRKATPCIESKSLLIIRGNPWRKIYPCWSNKIPSRHTWLKIIVVFC